MDPVRVLRGAVTVLVLTVLVGAAVLGGAVLAGPTSTPSPRPTPTATPTAAVLPAADARGADLARLPRYPGSVRTGYAVHGDDRFRLTAVEYLADATVDMVRLFYQGVIDEHGWERVDIQYADGEWAYVLVDGNVEALIEIEPEHGLVEIDLQVSEPVDSSSPSPSPSPKPTPTPTRAPTVAPSTPVPVPPDDDGDDDDSDDGFGGDD